MSKRNFQCPLLRPIMRSTGLAEHPTASTLDEVIALSCMPHAGNKGEPNESQKTVGPSVAVSLVAASVTALA
jgi:hypothetical protein